ncbi:MAG: DUF3570 domain-containing protein [Candidatus Saccharimonadales bacterium]
MESVAAVVAVTNKAKQTNALAALTLATLALPGIIPSVAAQAEYFDLNSQFSRYSESGNRMKIDVYQASAVIPVSERFNLNINGVKDIITGASPVMNIPKANGQPYQVLSGASIKDVRDAFDIAGTYTHGLGNVGIDVGHSSENDYNSTFFNVDSRFELNQKRTTLATGYSFSSDNVWAIDHCPPHCVTPNGSGLSNLGLTGGNTTPPPPTIGTYRRADVGGEKYTHQGLLGVTQILDKDSLVQANLTYTHNQGYLSDPYKAVYTPWVTTPYPGYSDFGGYSHDTRPSNRDQFAVLMRYVHHFSSLNSAAMHLDYRYYADTWGINANTFEFSWIQPIWSGWEITPRARYYSQDSANFYQPYFTAARTDGYYSSDYRLASFGAISGGAQLSKEFFDRLSLAFGIDFYQRQESYKMNGGIGSSVDNFSFSMFSAKISFKY